MAGIHVARVFNPCVVYPRRRLVLQPNLQSVAIFASNSEDSPLCCAFGVPNAATAYRGHGLKTHATKISADCAAISVVGLLVLVRPETKDNDGPMTLFHPSLIIHHS